MTELSEFTAFLGSPENSTVPQATLWGRLVGGVCKDLAQGIIGFIPNGVDVIYDTILMPLPYVGSFFSNLWTQDFLKICCGITIGKALAEDIARYVFWPLGFIVGFVLGFLIGSIPVFRKNSMPEYKGQVGQYLRHLSGQTVLGAVLGFLLFLVVGKSGSKIDFSDAALFVGIGAGLGMFAKSTFLITLHTLRAANAASSRMNVSRARKLSEKLKAKAKDLAHQEILAIAKAIILQMNGPQPEGELFAFFEERYEAIADTIYFKIDRHLNYLTDRAAHGDLEALRKLYHLYQTPKKSKRILTLEEMLSRIFSEKAIDTLKDQVDTLYDFWMYRTLCET
ncbi:MAG TPA: hypothetical protein VJ205_00540 [Gammaproteobacteria bacterium]|nr:hypothetical protein [Gammaproteobacteria bacterium]